MFDIFSANKSKNEAKKRLTMVLTYERKGLPPNFVEKFKDDLISFLSRYPLFDLENIEVTVKEDNLSLDELWISIPFKE